MDEKNVQHIGREEALTCGLCQALILKREVSCERYALSGLEGEQVQCPLDCHACCRSGVTLDLTSVEALMVYLLNRELVDLLEEYVELHGEGDYCPFLISDKCIIHTYKPTACQMFMPFAYRGNPMCYYLAGQDFLPAEGERCQGLMNSNSYAVHGCMAKIQREVAEYFPVPFFQHIYAGTVWWKQHYHGLPGNTRTCLESILLQGDTIGDQLSAKFDFGAALQAGDELYMDLCEKRAEVLPCITPD